MLRQSLLKVSHDRRVRSTVLNAPITPELVKRFVAGQNVTEVVGVAGDLISKGMGVIIDQLGEDSSTVEQARAVADEYQVLLRTMDEAGLASAGEVAVKLSALGLHAPGGGTGLALELAGAICATAAQTGAKVTIDMEDHTTTDATLNLVTELRGEFPDTGLVLQAYLHRTEDDCQQFATAGSRVRLCKGAYARVSGISFTTNHAIDRSYVRCLRVLMEGEGYPMVATHDPRLIAIAEKLARDTKRSRDSFEFQMLYGVRAVEQRRLVDIGYRSSVYLPYGTQWYEYFARRVAEKPSTVALIGRSLLSRR